MTAFLRIPEVVRRVGYPRSTVYLRVKQGLLPAPVHLGGQLSGWIEHELEAVLRARAVGADDSHIQKLVARIHAERDLQRAEALGSWQ